MDDYRKRIVERKAELDALRPLSHDLLASLRSHLDVELTYSSNAIEGNTLTLRETAEIIEHGITVGAKPIKDYLEALDHHEAIRWMREQAETKEPLGEATITELHRRIVLRSNPDIAGNYSSFPRRITGSAVILPNPTKIPSLMQSLGERISQISPDPADAFDAHYRLVAIHPFADGNGRTARLLMNLVLLKNGFPPISVRPEDRAEYLRTLEHASMTNDLDPFQQLMHARLATTLDTYVGFFHEAGIFPQDMDAAYAAYAAQRGLDR